MQKKKPQKKFVREIKKPPVHQIDKTDFKLNLNLLLSKNLTLKECLHSDTADQNGINNNKITKEQLLNGQAIATAIFQPVRNECGPIIINSGFRSAALNRELKGAANSQHVAFEALDLQCVNNSNAAIFIFIQKNLKFDQLIWEFGTAAAPQWVHVSFKRLEENRGEVLRSFRNSTGKVYYLPT